MDVAGIVKPWGCKVNSKTRRQEIWFDFPAKQV